MQSGKRGRDQGRNGNVHNPRTRATPVWGDTVAGLDGCPHATDRVTSPRLATACRSCPNYNGPAGFRISRLFGNTSAAPPPRRFTRTFEDGESFYVEHRPGQLAPRRMADFQTLQRHAWADLTEHEQAAVIDFTTRILADTLIATDLLDSQNRPIMCSYEGLYGMSFDDRVALLNLIREDHDGQSGDAPPPAASAAAGVPRRPTPPTWPPRAATRPL